MDRAIHASIPLLQTNVHITHGDITQIEADVIVSSDDVYLSMGGGVSYAISHEAGDTLRDDVRKQQLPVPLGSVIVTSAGRLRAKYVFHATTLDFVTRISADSLIAHLVQRIFEMGTALQVRHIAFPLLGAGTAGLPQEQVFKYLLQSILYFLITETFTINEVTIVLYHSKDLGALLEEFSSKVASSSAIQQRIMKLEALRDEMINDSDLNEMLTSRIAKAKQELCDIFYFKAIDEFDNFQQDLSTNYKGYKDARDRLQQILGNLQEEVENKSRLQQIEERRKRVLEERQALEGINISPEVRIEIEDIANRNDKRNQEIQQIEIQKTAYQREFERLRYK